MTRRRLFLAMVMLTLVASSHALACSCNRLNSQARSFLNSAPAWPLVVRAVVDRHVEQTAGGVYLAMDLKIIEVLRGSSAEPVIRVYGDNGQLCSPYVTTFPEKSEWIFAVSQSRFIPGCQQNWLRVEAGRAKGNIEGNENAEIAVAELRARLNSPTLEICTECLGGKVRDASFILIGQVAELVSGGAPGTTPRPSNPFERTVFVRVNVVNVLKSNRDPVPSPVYFRFAEVFAVPRDSTWGELEAAFVGQHFIFFAYSRPAALGENVLMMSGSPLRAEPANKVQEVRDLLRKATH